MSGLRKDWDWRLVEVEQLAERGAFQGLLDAIVGRAKPRPEDRAVDVGAGTGRLTLALARRVQRVWALESSPGAVDYLRGKAASAGFRNIETVVASALSLPLGDAAADLVVSNYCFHHVSDRDKLRALSEVHRVLVPGGRVVIGDMMLRPGADRHPRPAAPFRLGTRAGGEGSRLRRTAGGEPPPLRPDSPAEARRPGWWEAALADVGFVAVEVEPLPHEGRIAVGRRAR
jgi:SAM-dependent methyltransferase